MVFPRRAQLGDFLANAKFRWANLHSAPYGSWLAFTPAHDALQGRFAATQLPWDDIFWCEKSCEVGFCNWDVGATSLFTPS